jgi:hypothetical protein
MSPPVRIAVFAAAVMASSLLSACATVPMPGDMTQDGNDCAVIAAVAKEHCRFNSDRPQPIRFEGDYRPICDWSGYGLAFVPFEPDGLPPRRDWVGWVSFSRPSYDGQEAVVESAIAAGINAGKGVRCRLHFGFAGWTLSDCQVVWES